MYSLTCRVGDRFGVLQSEQSLVENMQPGRYCSRVTTAVALTRAPLDGAEFSTIGTRRRRRAAMQ